MKVPKSITGIMAEEAARPEESAAAKVMAVLSLHLIWPEIVGGQAAEHCRPAGFRKGVLTIAAENPAWTQEMSFLVQEIQERLDSALGKGVVTELRFKTAKLPRRRKKPEPRRKQAVPNQKKPSLPPDPALLVRLEKELEGIEDRELREVLLRVRLGVGR